MSTPAPTLSESKSRPTGRSKRRRLPAAIAIDLHVSGRLKAARLESGQSQFDAGGHIGVTFQQLQKYEGGSNRISAGNLLLLARAYGKPVEWFFAGAKV